MGRKIGCGLVKKLLVIWFFLYVQPVLAQDDAAHQYTEVPVNARFVFLQSEIAAKVTLRLDRFSGDVFQLVTDAEGNLGWEQMPVYSRPVIRQNSCPRFSLFTSSFGVRMTFLMDNDTGQTWQLQQEDRGSEIGKVNVWAPLSE